MGWVEAYMSKVGFVHPIGIPDIYLFFTDVLPAK
jgi:hypothetical protein